MKNSMQVVLMLISTRAGDEEIINVSISKRKATKNLVNKVLKCLCGIAKNKRHLNKWHLKESDQDYYSRLMNIG